MQGVRLPPQALFVHGPADPAVAAQPSLL